MKERKREKQKKSFFSFVLYRDLVIFIRIGEVWTNKDR